MKNFLLGVVVGGALIGYHSGWIQIQLNSMTDQ
jgi:hypothetical protein